MVNEVKSLFLGDLDDREEACIHANRIEINMKLS